VQSRHFAYPFQVSDDATQMELHKTLYPFYITKKMLNVTATAANSVDIALRQLCQLAAQFNFRCSKSVLHTDNLSLF